MSLKLKVQNGIKWTTVSTVIGIMIQLLQLIVLSRFLEPSAFGLMAIVMVVIGFSQAFLDMGISSAIIHKQEISKNQLSTLYWINILSGFILFCIIVLLSSFISEFYNENELTNLIFIVALTFIIQPFGQQFMVLWQKNMRFSEIAKIDILNKFITLIVSIFLAYEGFGVYSLVYGVLSGVIIQTVLYIYQGLKEYRPSYVFKIREVNEFLSFGAFQMGDKMINFFNREIDTLLIGKLLGVESLGIYTIAKQVIMKPLQLTNYPITKITFPLMSKLQNDIPKLKNVYLKTINYLCSINFSIYVFIFIMSPDLVPLIFGDKWMESTPVIQILSIYGAVRSAANPMGSLLLAKGKANWGFYWNLGLLLYIPLGIYISSQWGIIGVSWGLVFIMLSLIIPGWYFMIKNLCGASFVEYHEKLIIPAIITILAGIFTSIFIGSIGTVSLRLILGLLVGSTLVVVFNIIFNRTIYLDMKYFFLKK